MRKKDYLILAFTIRDLLKQASELTDPHAKCILASMLRQLAYQFAAKASVKPDEFLKACNIDIL